MQPVSCMLSGRRFEHSFENAQWRRVKKCNRCEYALSESGNLRRHLKKHIGEKTNKCKQCYFRSSQASHLRARLKIQSGEKSHKCNQCDYESSGAEVLRGHLKTHRRKAKQMQRMQLCILSNRPFKETYENTKKCNQCYYTSSREEKFMMQCEYYSV